MHPDAVLPAPKRVEPVAASEPAEETETAVVAHGHTIHAPTDQRIMVGFDSVTNAPVYRAVCKIYGPGETVVLPASEVARFKELGHLYDETKIAPANTIVGDVPGQVH